MNKQDVVNFINSTKRSVSKHSPEILTGIGIAGMLTTTVLAVKATPKALVLIEQKKKEERKDELTPVEVVKTCWKPYIPATLSGAASIACLIGANSINAKRNAALAAAYKLSETALIDYKAKVVETIGEKKEQAIKDKIAKEKVENNPASSSQIIVTGRGNSRIYDQSFGRYFTSDIELIKKAVNELNRRMISEMYISLNEFYREIGIDEVELGDSLGWNIEQGYIEIDWSSQICDDGTPCLVMGYLVAPRYDFDKLM